MARFWLCGLDCARREAIGNEIKASDTWGKLGNIIGGLK
jgi:hypothetical protein